MNLLLTNDDGYDAPGLKVLAEILSRNNNVYVVGPDRNRSAVSNHATLFGKLGLEKTGEKSWKSEGYPADCASIGVESDLTGVKIDAVVSGINCGANMGSDIIFSGTCAAARMAVLSGVPGIAVSLDPIDWAIVQQGKMDYKPVAEFVEKNLEVLVSMSNLNYPRMFVNVNAGAFESYKGAKTVTKICKRRYNDKIEVFEEEGKLYTKCVFGEGSTLEEEGSDFDLVRKGFVTVSRVYVEPLCDEQVDDINFKL